MNEIAAVTFDCWGTLLTDTDMTHAVEARVAAIVSASNLDAEPARALGDRAWREHHDAWERGEHYGSEGMARFIVAELSLEDALAEHLTISFEEAAMHGNVEPLPGARQTLEGLRGAGVPTALVCDTGYTPGRIVRRFLDDHGLRLDHLAFSDEVGVPKPDRRIFESALRAIGATPQEAVHIGDLLRTDVAGARGVGMRSIRITGVNQRGTSSGLGGPLHTLIAEPDTLPDEADHVVSSHAELQETLRGLGVPL